MNKRIKVIQIAHCSHSYFLGDGEEELKKLVLNDWYSKTSFQLKKFCPEIEIECWAPEKTDKKESSFCEQGIKFRFFPVTFSPRYTLDLSIPLLKELKKEIQKSKKEEYKLIIHIHEVHNLHGLLIATLFPGENLIVQHHGGSWPLKHLNQTKKYRYFFPFFLLAQFWEKIVLKNISSFFVLTIDEMNYLKKIAPESKIIFQTMGIEDFYFKEEEKELSRKKLGLNPKKKNLLFLGRINETKGIHYLLEAMKKLEKENITLNIGGFGKEQKNFEDYAKELELNNTKFLGGIFNEEKRLYLNASDALVLPSLKEGAPVTVMEAMASNLPCVVTDVGGVRLMIKDGREGVIIKPKDPEEIVRGVKEVLGWKKKNIQKYAECYKWNKIIQETINNYKKISK